MTPLEPQPTQLYCEGIEGAVGWLSDGPKSNVCLSRPVGLFPAQAQSEKGNRRRYRFLPLSGFITIQCGIRCWIGTKGCVTFAGTMMLYLWGDISKPKNKGRPRTFGLDNDAAGIGPEWMEDAPRISFAGRDRKSRSIMGIIGCASKINFSTFNSIRWPPSRSLMIIVRKIFYFMS